MPHKIYACCDSNRCECGKAYKLYDRKSDRKVSTGELLSQLSTEALFAECELRAVRTEKDKLNAPTLNKIKELECQIAKLKEGLL